MQMQAAQSSTFNEFENIYNEYFNFKDLYDKVFEVRRALTPKDIHEAHKIRYQVYCIENQYEDPDQNQHGQEYDEYDKNCITSILIHRHTGLVVGTVRVVLPQNNNADDCFPIQKVCDLRHYDPDYDPMRTGEISRFCISKQMRKRICDTSQYLAVTEPDMGSKCFSTEDRLTKRIIPYAALGLVRAVFEIGSEYNMRYIYASMEPYLIRSLYMLGIPSTNLGPVVEYHGKRQPARFDALEVFNYCKKNNYNTWRIISNNGELQRKEIQAIENERSANKMLFY